MPLILLFLLAIPFSGTADASTACRDTVLANSQTARICVSNFENPVYFDFNELVEEDIIPSRGGDIFSCLTDPDDTNSPPESGCTGHHPYYLQIKDYTNGASGRSDFFLVQEVLGSGFKRIRIDLIWRFNNKNYTLRKNQSIAMPGSTTPVPATLEVHIKTSNLNEVPAGLYAGNYSINFETHKGKAAVIRSYQIRAELNPAAYISGVNNIDLSGKPANGVFSNESSFCVFSRTGDYNLMIEGNTGGSERFELKASGDNNLSTTIPYRVRIKDKNQNRWRQYDKPGTQTGLKGSTYYFCDANDNAILKPEIQLKDLAGVPAGDYFDILTLTVQPR